MPTNSALMMVRVSSWSDASIYVVVDVGEYITEAPRPGLPFFREPFV